MKHKSYDQSQGKAPLIITSVIKTYRLDSMI